MPNKLPIVTRWATNRFQMTNGFYNRLEEEPLQEFIDKGFTTNILPRQLLNYILYNHGENLDYSVYYTNKPFSVATKDLLPIAGENTGIIYHVIGTSQLVISVNNQWKLIATIGEAI